MKLPARIVLLLFSLFVSGAIPSLARAKADELPADTNSIQSLTVEQARQLVSERQQMREEHRDSDDSILDVIRILNPDSAAAMAAARGGDLTLPALKSLDASTAEALQEFEGHLSLPGLKEIDVAVAHALEGFQGDLSLDGLETLDPSVAKALAELWCKRLSLGIGWLDARTAKVLAKAQCDQLILQRLGLGAGVAEALAEFGGHLHCSGGNRISPDAAKALAGCKCLSLSLDGITSLDAITAEGLAQTKAGLTFNVTSLRYDAAKALGQSKCRALTFSSLKTLHSDAASALAEFTGHLHLSISSLDGDSARSLLEGRSASLLIACGVGQGLDEKTAEAIERSNKKCWLDPEATSAAAAEWAVKTSGRTLRFRREEIDSEIAKVLVQFKGDGIQLDEVESLSVGAAKAIAAFAGRRLSLSGLKTLDSQVAAALAAFKGERLSLNALEAVTADVARALSGFGGQRLDLANLTSLDAGALHALAECKGERLYIPTVMRRIGNEIPLDAVTARLVCASYGEVVLPSVVALESADAVDVALALAQRKGPLSIPNLKKITPKTLAALKLKKDVVLPSEGTLTFVPDSYDYVTLAWLEKERPRAVTVLEAKALLAGMKRSLKALDLQSVTALDAATAEVLAKFKGEKISFAKLPEIDAKTARAITRFKGERLCFPGLKTLDGETARALGMSRCWDCELPALITLDQETASELLKTSAFSPSNQRLSFGGLKKLEAATANVLRHYQGNELALDGLAAIDAETAKWLSEAKCKSLALRGLTSLTPEGAKALSQFRGDYLLLDGVTSLDMATARALVAFKGKGLRLSGLAMIEADAAKTLWNNPKIEIPARFRK